MVLLRSVRLKQKYLHDLSFKVCQECQSSFCQDPKQVEWPQEAGLFGEQETDRKGQRLSQGGHNMWPGMAIISHRIKKEGNRVKYVVFL